MRDPVEILVKKDELTLEGIKQFFVNVEKEVCKFEDLDYRVGWCPQHRVDCHGEISTENHYIFISKDSSTFCDYVQDRRYIVLANLPVC